MVTPLASGLGSSLRCYCCPASCCWCCCHHVLELLLPVCPGPLLLLLLLPVCPGPLFLLLLLLRRRFVQKLNVLLKAAAAAAPAAMVVIHSNCTAGVTAAM